jgi:muramoyltetrapeptide carboxypeptidase LdcA involved in peptidoglycan recycling
LEDSLYKSTSNAIQRSGFESVNLRNSFQKSHARIYAEESERVNEFESALADVA